jgi:hypothetical protein
MLLPERGESRPPKVVPATGEMVDVIDELVSAVWEYMEQWGLAVANGYWKPVLHVEVAKGAEYRYRELEVLLEGSGFEVKRKEP